MTLVHRLVDWHLSTVVHLQVTNNSLDFVFVNCFVCCIVYAILIICTTYLKSDGSSRTASITMWLFILHFLWFQWVRNALSLTMHAFHLFTFLEGTFFFACKPKAICSLRWVMLRPALTFTSCRLLVSYIPATVSYIPTTVSFICS